MGGLRKKFLKSYTKEDTDVHVVPLNFVVYFFQNIFY